jgi:cytochrome c oxidase accessory protein FixG
VAHIETFLGLTFFTIVFYLVFARYREQACLVACPYGRFMSALVDENTVTVTYDWLRGEPRSKWKKNDPRALERKTIEPHTTPLRSAGEDAGHCVDCFECVRACPTGVDIRNGIQLECIACTACLDACDLVMDKTGLPRGLIRYTSATAVQTNAAKWLTPRIKAYMAIWSVLVIAVVTMFLMRSTLDITILRTPGTTWTQTSNGVANFYELAIINKSDGDLPYELSIAEPSVAKITPLGLKHIVGAGDILKGRFLITIPDHGKNIEQEHAAHGNTEIDILIDVNSHGKTMKQIKSEFLLP